MRLTALLREHAPAATPTTDALAALMYLHAARLPARMDAAGDLYGLVDQDRSLWNERLLSEGLTLFERSASGSELTAYHIEAAIAAVHAGAPSVDETDWVAVVGLYDQLMEVAPSPVVALNRAIAIAERDGADRGLDELYAIADRDRLSGYPFYAAAMGELELRRGNHERAREHFHVAVSQARNSAERRFLESRLRVCAAGAATFRSA
jgi:RNA polymerase sigma-70 factor (ECF subfamily)